MPGIVFFKERKKASSQDGAAPAPAAGPSDPGDPPAAIGAGAPPAVPPEGVVPGGDAAADSFAALGLGDGGRPDTSGSHGFSHIGAMFGGHGRCGADVVGGPPEGPSPFAPDGGAGGDVAMFGFDGGVGELQGGNGEILSLV